VVVVTLDRHGGSGGGGWGFGLDVEL